MSISSVGSVAERSQVVEAKQKVRAAKHQLDATYNQYRSSLPQGDQITVTIRDHKMIKTDHLPQPHELRPRYLFDGLAGTEWYDAPTPTLYYNIHRDTQRTIESPAGVIRRVGNSVVEHSNVIYSDNNQSGMDALENAFHFLGNEQDAKDQLGSVLQILESWNQPVGQDLKVKLETLSRLIDNLALHSLGLADLKRGIPAYT